MKAKQFYGESGKHVPTMLKKKKAWFDEPLKNPIENIGPEPTKKPKKRGPKKRTKVGHQKRII